jgi:predicted nuclease of predicted toxin-antitoxin system
LKLKIDENLPGECAEILIDGGWQADTVADEGLTGADDSVLASASRSEGRILVTLDLDFANIRAYPPAEYAGIIVLRPKRQDKQAVLDLVHRFALVLAKRPPANELWIVEPDRIRFRSDGNTLTSAGHASQSSFHGMTTTRLSYFPVTRFTKDYRKPLPCQQHRHCAPSALTFVSKPTFR